jgi:hypothetical protein
VSRPADLVVAAAAAGKFTSSPKSTSAANPARHQPPPPRAAFTIPEFCEAHRFSPARYYEIKKEGWGPDEMVVGRRRMVSFEAAERWRRAREAG